MLGRSLRSAGWGFSVLQYLVDVDPPLLGSRALDRVADCLHRRALREVRLPRAFRPPIEQISEVVDEARAVAHTLPDRPPVGGVRVALLLGADPPHAVQLRSVPRVAVEQLVEAGVVEQQRAVGPPVLARVVAAPPDRNTRPLRHTSRTRVRT